MKRLNIILAFFLIINHSFGQVKCSAKLIDKDSKTAIAYVNIGILNTTLGTVSNEEGQFELNAPSKNDSLMFSSIGYENLILSIDKILQKDSIFLQPIAYEFEQVELTSFNFDKEVILGERNENGRGKSVGFGNAQLGTELGALIKIEKETLIKSVHFVLNHAKGDSLLLRINIYDYKDKKIGEKVVKRNIIIKDKQRKGTYSIDLSAYEIILKNDVLLSVEWLRNFDETGNKLITFDTKKSKSHKGTYIKLTSSNEFKKYPFIKKIKPCLYFIGKQNSKE